MIGFVIGLLTLVMVLDCVVLVFLVLLQLPKKEAGAGLAFGGAASDALFGAGSGNVLTKITKYAATVFFALAVVLSMMQSRYHRQGGSAFERQLASPSPLSTAPAVPAPAAAPAPAPSTAAAIPAATNLPAKPVVEDTNLPARPPASSPASKP